MTMPIMARVGESMATTLFERFEIREDGKPIDRLTGEVVGSKEVRHELSKMKESHDRQNNNFLKQINDTWRIHSQTYDGKKHTVVNPFKVGIQYKRINSDIMCELLDILTADEYNFFTSIAPMVSFPTNVVKIDGLCPDRVVIQNKLGIGRDKLRGIIKSLEERGLLHTVKDESVQRIYVNPYIINSGYVALSTISYFDDTVYAKYYNHDY